MSDIYSINKSRIGYAYQYKYALLKILKFMLAGRLRSIRVDFPFFPNSLINLSLDVKLELMDPNESYVYEIKTGDNFKGSKIEELKKVLKNLYLFEQCNKGNNCKKFIVISPEVKSQILDHWNDFLFIKSRNRKNLHNENQTKVQKRVFDKLSFDTNLCMGDFIRFIRQTAFDIGPSYTNDSALDNLSDLEDQVESEVGNFCTKLSLRTSEIEIPAWSVALELLDVLNKCSEDNKDALEDIFKKLGECLSRKELVKEAIYKQDKEKTFDRIKKRMNKKLIDITKITSSGRSNIFGE